MSNHNTHQNNKQIFHVFAGYITVYGPGRHLENIIWTQAKLSEAISVMSRLVMQSATENDTRNEKQLLNKKTYMIIRKKILLN